jgi:hypothetical protein
MARLLDAALVRVRECVTVAMCLCACGCKRHDKKTAEGLEVCEVCEGLLNHFLFSIENKKYLAFTKMGCLKLTYDYQEQGEKNSSLKWRVWVNPNSDFLEVDNQQTQGGEYADDAEYRLRAFTVDVKILGLEFISGLGPERSMFRPEHPFIEDLRKSFILERAIEHYNANYTKGQTMRMHDVTVLEQEADKLRSPIEHFIGSARISIVPMEHGTMYQIDNTTDRHSGSFDTMDPKPRDPKRLTPTGTIYQRFIWVEWNK